ncbi:MAG: GyrI-like domain-containing protein [Rhodobacter sp.]|nr:GyrI-like domain-containing protein [Rhodobacter sp.]
MITPDRIEEAPARRLVGANGRYTKDTRGGIPRQWGNWDYAALTGVVGELVFGVSHGFAPGSFQYLCGMEVSADAPVPEGQIELCLPSGPHAVFVHQGHVSGIATMFDRVLNGAHLGDGWVMAPGPQYEVYTEDFDPQTATGKVELWFPIEQV